MRISDWSSDVCSSDLTVALVYGNNGRSVGAQYGGGEPTTPTGQYDAAYGMTSAGAYVALMYERYRQTYNVPDDGLAEVSINNRKHAKLNANAVMHDDLDVNIYMESDRKSTRLNSSH